MKQIFSSKCLLVVCFTWRLQQLWATNYSPDVGSESRIHHVISIFSYLTWDQEWQLLRCCYGGWTKWFIAKEGINVKALGSCSFWKTQSNMYKVCIWSGASHVVFTKLEKFYWCLHVRTESPCNYSRATCSDLLGRHLVQNAWEHSIHFILKASFSHRGNAVGYRDSRARGPFSPFIGRGKSTGQYRGAPCEQWGYCAWLPHCLERLDNRWLFSFAQKFSEIN